MRGFASDNYAGIHPEVLAAIAAANEGHAVAYGDDPWTDRVRAAFRRHLGEQAEVFPTFNGTGANVVGLQALLRPWENVICAATAHINVDECGAPERLLGSKLVDLATPDGRLTPDLVRAAYAGRGDVHHVQPRVVSITQSSELGTVYTPDEVRALADTAHELDMYLHMDGARICNAAASLDVPLRATTTDCGVDVLSFGGTKNGLLGGEAVVVLRPDLADVVPYARKQSMQLASKMRFVAAQFLALLDGDLWRRSAAHANAMARRLADGVREVPGLTVSYPVQANAVFVRLPGWAIPQLQAAYPFYVWDQARDEVRWMCSWDTTSEDVDAFVALVQRTLVRRTPPAHPPGAPAAGGGGRAQPPGPRRSGR